MSDRFQALFFATKKSGSNAGERLYYCREPIGNDLAQAEAKVKAMLAGIKRREPDAKWDVVLEDWGGYFDGAYVPCGPSRTYE